MELWTRLPWWVKFGSAVVLLGYSLQLAARGVAWPAGLGVGCLLLFLSFLKPLGPARKRPATRTSAELAEEDPYGGVPILK